MLKRVERLEMLVFGAIYDDKADNWEEYWFGKHKRTATGDWILIEGSDWGADNQNSYTPNNWSDVSTQILNEAWKIFQQDQTPRKHSFTMTFSDNYRVRGASKDTKPDIEVHLSMNIYNRSIKVTFQLYNYSWTLNIELRNYLFRERITMRTNQIGPEGTALCNSLYEYTGKL